MCPCGGKRGQAIERHRPTWKQYKFQPSTCTEKRRAGGCDFRPLSARDIPIIVERWLKMSRDGRTREHARLRLGYRNLCAGVVCYAASDVARRRA
ncbi:uncharacterized protein SCHCODRAFT_02622975 [Schizophyllum commune H4-8]|uniref:uncharacterized protein n=1 Tax=Schizophyllum commune (strain H4-8 / FGSC 9210) TaxID=578458 RepID=UPI00215FA7C2|nr:uncharacterized protein SCHCODRAFT_02622975 [Schizophyllum commune H4-8]KAI5893859.1 hypothetical protein SCHCODRAFT_02622975 [Schizophyllum commune H4-8]